MTVSPLTQLRRFPTYFLNFSLLLRSKPNETITALKQNNQLLKEQVDSLSKEVLERRNCENSTFFE